MWIALNLHTYMELTINGVTNDVPIANMVDFSTGCMMVFENREDAIRHAGDENSIIEILYKDPKIFNKTD